MNSLELFLATRLFTRALEHTCPSLVPRSGLAGAKINCFSIYIDKESGPYLLVRDINGTTLSCSEWTGSSFDKPTEISLGAINSKDISITHFYGQSEVQFKGIIDFALGRFFLLPYFKLYLVRTIEATDQYFFNKKKLVTKQRIELLRFLVQRHLDGNSIASHVDLMTGLYSIKWVLHPDKDAQIKRLRFYLRSLVDTGELKYEHGAYQLTGEALRAIELYEEQERKHTENVKIQRRMLYLTLAIVLLTAAQADLIKFPTLLDLRDWHMATTAP